MRAHLLAVVCTIVSISAVSAVARPSSAATNPTYDRGPLRHPSLAPVAYTVIVDDPFAQLVHVTMRLSDYGPAPLEVAMPAWTPGAYQLVVPARNVSRLRAHTEDGADVPVERLGRERWRVAARGEPVTLDYTVYAPRQAVTTSALRRNSASLNGFDLYLYVVGNEATPCRLTVVPYTDWSVVVPLPREPDGSVVATSYDVLIDSPALLGHLNERVVTVLGRRHHVVWTGHTDLSLDAVTSDLVRLVPAIASMFGGELPYDEYWFLLHFEDGGGGGLEHLASARIDGASRGYLEPGQVDSFLSIMAHELMHAWIVKRIRPRSLDAIDVHVEADTPDLWFLEGVTSYAADLALTRAGLWTTTRLLQSICGALEAYEATPARAFMSPEESGMTAWYRAENGAAGRLNYYNAGFLLGLTLDLELRRRPPQSAAAARGPSLDAVLQALWAGYRATTAAYAPGTLERITAEVAGEDFSWFFQRFVRGVESIPVEAALEVVDLAREPKPGRRVAWLGVTTAADGDAIVKVVDEPSPAATAGVQAGDVLVAMDGQRISGADVTLELRRRKPSDTLELAWFHGDTLRFERVTLEGRELMPDAPGVPAAERTRTQLIRLPSATADAAFTRWLSP